MSQHYSNPAREAEPTALPDVEVFYLTVAEARQLEHCGGSDDEPDEYRQGWYYWFCFPGCLPDSDVVGPFASEADALRDAQEHGG